MSALEDLIRHAMAGSERMGRADELRTALGGVPTRKEPDDPEYLLEAATWIWMSKRSRILYQVFQDEDQDQNRSSEMDLRPMWELSRRMHYLFHHSAGQKWFLRELLSWLHSFKVAIAPAKLPFLLDAAIYREELQEGLKKVLGPFGESMARSHPTWRYIFVTDTGILHKLEYEDWAMKRLRECHPEQFFDWAREKWEKSTVFFRLKVLEVLRINGPSPEEIPFLENALRMERGDVLFSLASVIWKYPGTGPGKKLWDLVRASLKPEMAGLGFEEIQRRRELMSIGFPDNLIEEVKRHGGVLPLLLRCVEPRQWEVYFNTGARELIKVFCGEGRMRGVLEGLSEAVIQWESSDWAVPLLKEIIGMPELWKEVGGRLSVVLSREDWDRILCEELRHPDVLKSSESHVLKLLSSGPMPWSTKVYDAFAVHFWPLAEREERAHDGLSRFMAKRLGISVPMERFQHWEHHMNCLGAKEGWRGLLHSHGVVKKRYEVWSDIRNVAIGHETTELK